MVGRQAVLERNGAMIKRETQKFKRFYPQPEQSQNRTLPCKGRAECSVSSAEGHEGRQQTAATEAGGMMAGSAPQPNMVSAGTASGTLGGTDDSRQTTVTERTTATAAPRRTPRTHGPPDRFGSWVTK